MIIRIRFSKILFLFLLLVVGFNVVAQTVEQDSVRIAQDNQEAEYTHSPKKATLYSAVLPGLGQAYNKKYWKIPLIYAGFGTIGYFIHWNNDNYQILKQAYSDLTDGDPDTDSYNDLDASEYYDLDDATELANFKTGLSKQQSYYRRNRDLLIISLIGFYGLQIIDASVDAHLFDFDISDDLTMKWQPTMNYHNQHTVYGINCTFSF